MLFSEKLRGFVFWSLDFFRGNPIRKHLQDVSQLMLSANETWAQQQIDDRLKRIQEHAVRTTSFYSKCSLKDGIESFPVVDKNSIRENIEKFLSSKYKEGERIPAITSGSTGTPFKTYQSKDKKFRNTADTLFFAHMGGYELGNKLYYFKIWSEYNKKSNLMQKVQNIVPIDVLNLKSQAPLVFKLLNKNKNPVSFLGYVSAFETLCKELDRNNILHKSLRVKSIITMSEGLNDYTKISAAKYFFCPVLSRYSNIENGILAQQTLADETVFMVNRASYYVEIMDINKDQRVTNGTLGRIVVTDYFNYVMPLIRYDTGDLGTLEERYIDGIKQLVLTRIEGRKLDQIYNTKGELISSYIVYKNMWNYMEIDQYQFVQKGPKEYVFKISITGKFLREKQLVNEFMDYLGADADFKLEYVHEIPLLDSGKRKKVVNEMSLERSRHVS